MYTLFTPLLKSVRVKTLVDGKLANKILSQKGVCPFEIGLPCGDSVASIAKCNKKNISLTFE